MEHSLTCQSTLPPVAVLPGRIPFSLVICSSPFLFVILSHFVRRIWFNSGVQLVRRERERELKRDRVMRSVTSFTPDGKDFSLSLPALTFESVNPVRSQKNEREVPVTITITTITRPRLTNERANDDERGGKKRQSVRRERDITCEDL